MNGSAGRKHLHDFCDQRLPRRPEGALVHCPAFLHSKTPRGVLTSPTSHHAMCAATVAALGAVAMSAMPRARVGALAFSQSVLPLRRTVCPCPPGQAGPARVLREQTRHLRAGARRRAAASAGCGGWRALASEPDGSDHRPEQRQAHYVETVASRLSNIALSSKTKRILFVTGAGMSAESGLPTYRGVTGLYNQGVTEDGMPIEDAISGPMLERRPAIAWKYIAQIEEACRGKQPNPGHFAIARLAEMFDVWVLTQNVDGLHTAAGSKQVIEIHGNVKGIACTLCSFEADVPSYQDLSYNKQGESDPSTFPKCPECGNLVRPKVVLFGEALDIVGGGENLDTLQAQMRQSFDAVFSVGTTSVFPYIAAPVVMGARGGAFTVEINPGQTEVSDLVDVQVPLPAGGFLQAVVQRLLASSRPHPE